MPKRTPKEFPVHPLIRERWRLRAFSDEPIVTEVLLGTLVEFHASWAKSKPIREFVRTGTWGHTAPFAAK